MAYFLSHSMTQTSWVNYMCVRENDNHACLLRPWYDLF